MLTKARCFVLLLFIFSALAVWCQKTSTTPANRTDATATAATVLRAYSAKDLPALGELSTADNREIIRELIAQGESHPRWRSIFSGGRWEAVTKWNGSMGEARYFERTAGEKKAYDARVQFAGAETPDRVAVVTLSWEAGKWCFEDVNFPSRESFERGSKTPPAIP